MTTILKEICSQSFVAYALFTYWVLHWETRFKTNLWQTLYSYCYFEYNTMIYLPERYNIHRVWNFWTIVSNNKIKERSRYSSVWNSEIGFSHHAMSFTSNYDFCITSVFRILKLSSTSKRSSDVIIVDFVYFGSRQAGPNVYVSTKFLPFTKFEQFCLCLN